MLFSQKLLVQSILCLNFFSFVFQSYCSVQEWLHQLLRFLMVQRGKPGSSLHRSTPWLGNLTLLGSVANLIVCEQARRAQFFGYSLAQFFGYNLTFWSHLRFGVSSTIIFTAIGLLIVISY